MNSNEREQLAKQRFFTMAAMRFGAVIFVGLGIANIGGKFVPEVSPILGYAFLVIGTIHFFLMPVTLKRIWQKQDAEKG